MKKFTVTISCVLLSLFVSCRQHDYREISMDVPGLRNDSCVRIIANAFGKAKEPGIQPDTIRYDIPGRKITLTYDSLLIADKNIEFIVAKAGFAANEIPADTKAAEALPAQCKR